MIKRAIYIDGSFIFHSARSKQFKIDYNKLLKLISGDAYIVYAAYYSALPGDKDIEANHKKFLRVLKKDAKLKVRTVPLHKVSRQTDGVDTSFKTPKGEDILLTCEMLRGAIMDHYDEAVLVSGDGDFVPVVNMVQSFGKRVIVVSFQDSFSKALEMEGNQVIILDQHLESLALTDLQP